MKTIGCIQSSYIPWRGYYDIIRQSNAFVFHDDLQYTKQDWRNRNRIKTPTGLQWLSVPVRKTSIHGPIDEVEIDNGQDWSSRHWRRIEANYRTAPFFADYGPIIRDTLAKPWVRLSEMNIHLISVVSDLLGLKTQFVHSRSLKLAGHKTDRLVAMCLALGGDRYLSGPTAQNYIEPEKFAAAGIILDYIHYDYEPYPQRFGAFVEGASIIDLIFNCGPGSGDVAFRGRQS